MLKLFRKVRKRMLSENKSARYFKYAFGEIILVVIGILIALQINTWNENRKAKAEEQKILKALQSDFKLSKTRIEETLFMQNRVMTTSRKLIDIHEREDESDYQFLDRHLDSLDFLISYGLSWYRAEPVTGAYNSLISAGKVDLIQNEELRHLLAQFDADLASGFEDQENAMDLLARLNDVLAPYVLKIASKRFRDRIGYGDRKTDTLEISEVLFTNDAFFGNLYTKSYLERNRLIRQKSLLSQTDTILNLIDKELDD